MRATRTEELHDPTNEHREPRELAIDELREHPVQITSGAEHRNRMTGNGKRKIATIVRPGVVDSFSPE